MIKEIVNDNVINEWKKSLKRKNKGYTYTVKNKIDFVPKNHFKSHPTASSDFKPLQVDVQQLAIHHNVIQGL